MGQASRKKWIQRALAYEGLVVKQGPVAAQEYLDRFHGKLQKFMKGTEELDDVREDLEEEEAAAGRS